MVENYKKSLNKWDNAKYFLTLCLLVLQLFWGFRILMFFIHSILSQKKGEKFHFHYYLFFIQYVWRGDLEEKTFKIVSAKKQRLSLFLNRFLCAVTYFYLQLYLHSKACKLHNITLVLCKNTAVVQALFRWIFQAIQGFWYSDNCSSVRFNSQVNNQDINWLL